MQIRPPASPGSAPSTALGSCVAPPCSLSGSAASAAASLASRPSADAACCVVHNKKVRRGILGKRPAAPELGVAHAHPKKVETQPLSSPLRIHSNQ